LGRSKSSQRWLHEHHNDHYVVRSKQDGYRSRASYKLLQLDRSDSLLQQGMAVIDLGSAPGGWSQVAADKVGATGLVVASDILPMNKLDGVHFIQGDFTEQSVLNEILTIVHGRPVNLVISDMAPNMTGVRTADQASATYLVELALELAVQVLGQDGNFVAKVFHGEGFDQILANAKRFFKKVTIRKPAASRARSSETYLVAKSLK